MKKGLDIGTLTSTLEFRHENRRDFVVNTLAMRLKWEEDKVTLKLVGPTVIPLDVTHHALHQISTHCGMPFQFVSSILEKGSVLEKEAVIHLMNVRLHANPAQRLIRTIREVLEPERMVAFLSDRYLRIDNWPLLNAILPVIRNDTRNRIVATHVDDTHFYIKVINTESTAQIGKDPVKNSKGEKVGDIIQSGVLISNSEVGLGSVQIRPFIVRLVCLNGMVATTEFGTSRKMHVGPIITDGDKNDNEVFLQNIANNVEALLSDTSVIKKLAGLFENAKTFKVTGDVGLLWESLKTSYGFSAAEVSVMTPETVNTKFDLVNVITYYAGSSRKVTVARATELEIIAGRILSMSKPEWAKIANQKLII